MRFRGCKLIVDIPVVSLVLNSGNSFSTSSWPFSTSDDDDDDDFVELLCCFLAASSPTIISSVNHGILSTVNSLNFRTVEKYCKKKKKKKKKR